MLFNKTLAGKDTTMFVHAYSCLDNAVFREEEKWPQVQNISSFIT